MSVNVTQLFIFLIKLQAYCDTQYIVLTGHPLWFFCDIHVEIPPY